MLSHTERRSTRRWFLSAAGATVVGGALATGSASAAESASFHLTQGETCIPLRPLQSDSPVKAFYDYRDDRYSSHGTRSLQRADTSLLFLYEGSDGVSLVFVHGKLGGSGDGGSVSFEISGLSSSGEWLVEDDRYDGPRRYDRWQTNDTTATIDWTWNGGRADGAVFGPLGDDTDIEIDPAFDEGAALYGEHYDGTIDDWQALSGDRSDPTRTLLDRTKPVRIERGACPPTETTTAGETQSTTQPRATATETGTNASPSTGSTAGDAPPTPGGASGTSGELKRLLNGFSRLLDRFSELIARAARFVERLSRSIGRYL